MPWSTPDIPNQTSRTAIVTGANVGLGLSTARMLVEKGAHVILACRNADKGAAAVASIKAGVPSAMVETTALDLSDLASVRAFAARMDENLGQLDLLINNAGVMAPPKSITKDGFELQFGTNHLGHFALTGLLMPLLEKAPAARVISLSSIAHRSGKIDFGNLNAEHKYTRWGAYGQSKLACLIFALEFQRRLFKSGSSIVSLAAHPGFSTTNLAQHMGPFGSIFSFLGQPADKGALPTLRAATAADAIGGEYYGPARYNGAYGFPVLETPSLRARDEAVAARLWGVSQELTGVAFL